MADSSDKAEETSRARAVVRRKDEARACAEGRVRDAEMSVRVK